MGNAQSASVNFLSLSYQTQREILESCMHHKLIAWANVLAQLYLDIKDKEFLSNLIENYKNGTNVPSTPVSLIQEMYKRQKTVIAPEDLKPAGVPNFAMTDVQRQLFTAILA